MRRCCSLVCTYSGDVIVEPGTAALKMFDVARFRRRRHRHRRPQADAEAEGERGRVSPKNIKSEATPVVAPKPKIETPPVNPIAAAEIRARAPPRPRARRTCSGPAPARAGSGPGPAAAPAAPGRAAAAGASPIRPSSSRRRLAAAISARSARQLAARRRIFLRLRIDANGFVTECTSIAAPASRDRFGRSATLAQTRLASGPRSNRIGAAGCGLVRLPAKAAR